MKMSSKIFLFAALFASMFAVRAAEPDAKADAKPDTKADAKAEAKTEPIKVTQGTNGETILTLDAETQKRLGLETAGLTPTEWVPEIKAYGRALDTAPLADLMMEFGQALLAFDNAHRELERAKKLKHDENISERAFQETEATYRQNFAAVMAVRLKIETACGSRIANLPGDIVVPPGTPRKMNPLLDELTRSAGLIRLDLPVGERLANPSTARIETLTKRDQPVTASFFDKLPALDSQTQQQGLLFLNDHPDTADALARGEAVTGFIKSSVAPVSGVTVPASAILRHEGKGWVFVQSGETTFSRRELLLDRTVADGFFTEQLSATNRVVVTGAQTLLSAELSGGGFNTGQRD